MLVTIGALPYFAWAFFEFLSLGKRGHFALLQISNSINALVIKLGTYLVRH